MYSYDSSGRLTQITANGTTLRTLYYDTNPFDSSLNTYATGRLTAIQHAQFNVNTPAGSTPYTFTEMFGYSQAAVTKKRLRLEEVVTYATGSNPPYAQATIHGDLDTNYTYDNEGRVLTTGYPATVFSTAPTYTNQFDTMGRLSGMTDQYLNQIVSGVTYGAANELLTFGNETRTYNKLFQLRTLTQTGRTITYTYPDGTNNGKITSQTYSDTGETVQYTYDSLNRFATATGTSPAAWGQTFVYDGFGNLTNRIPSGGAPSSPATPADPLTNRLIGYSYDNNGNSLSIGNIYDTENRLISALSGNVKYAYDGANKRIWVGNFSSGQLTSGQVFFYGLNGKKLGAYTPNITYTGQVPQSIVFNRDFAATLNTYFGASLVSQGGTAFVPDRLESNGRYFPYGEERNYPALPNDQVKFATYTRDNATGLDYADQRYCSASLGRFMTPDPYMASGGRSDPQSWNRYAYAQADPVNSHDPTGLMAVTPGATIPDLVQRDPCGPGPPGPAPNPGPFPWPSEFMYRCVPDPNPPQGGGGPTIVQLTSKKLPPGTYRAYASCYLSTVFGTLVSKPVNQIMGASFVGMIQGFVTGSELRRLAGFTGAVVFTVESFTVFDRSARACARESGYTPWMLQP